MVLQSPPQITWQPAGIETVCLKERSVGMPFFSRFNPVEGRYEVAVCFCLLFFASTPEEARAQALKYLRKLFA